jgi:hypothetical protein
MSKKVIPDVAGTGEREGGPFLHMHHSVMSYASGNGRYVPQDAPDVILPRNETPNCVVNHFQMSNEQLPA